MTELWQRIRHARERAGLNFPELAEAMGLSVSSVWQWESEIAGRRTAPSSNNLRKLAGVLGVSLEWLGSDESTLEELPSSGENTTKAPLGSLTHLIRRTSSKGYVRLPLMDIAASAGAGTPSNPDFPEVLEWINVAEWRVREWLGMVPTKDRVRLLTVRGDSMEPRLKNGDVCAIDTHCARFEGDGVYLLIIWENLYIKRLQLMTDGLHIISDNAALYKSEVIPPTDLDTVRICGRVLGAIAFKRSGEV